MVLGIDEAGRGAVLGNLTICGLLIDEKNERKLKTIGVKDSKQLTAKKRESLALEIEKLAKHIVVIHVPAHKIDANRKRGINLNQIEALTMAEIINMVSPKKVIIDSPSYNSNKFRDYLFSKIENKKTQILCENYADKNHPVVSGASIIAKVERDRKIRELEEKIGKPIGVGYPSDNVTIQFLEKLAEKNKGKMPSYVRTTWDTTEQIIRRYEQKGILNFLGKVVKK